MEMNNFVCYISGEIFKFYILIGDSKFHIAINDKAYCKYDFRMPVEEIRTIQLDYDLQLVTQIDHRSTYPNPFPPIQCEDSRCIFSNDVPSKFRPGKTFIIDLKLIIIKK